MKQFIQVYEFNIEYYDDKPDLFFIDFSETKVNISAIMKIEKISADFVHFKDCREAFDSDDYRLITLYDSNQFVIDYTAIKYIQENYVV